MPQSSRAIILLLAMGLTSTLQAQGIPGDLDPEFGQNGIVELSFSGLQNASFDVLLQDDQKIVLPTTVVGFQAVLRLNDDGTLDAGFGTQGAGGVITGASRTGALMEDGRILIAGRSPNNIAVTRFLPTGIRDSAFGSDGAATVAISGATSVAYDIVLLDDNSMILGGAAFPASTSQAVAARITSSGILDTSFGTNGLFVYQLPGFDLEIRSVTRHGDDHVVLAGFARSSENVSVGEMLLIRLSLDGTPDPGFGADGIVRLNPSMGLDALLSVTAMPNGSLVAAGTVSRDFAAVRLAADGQLDQNFGDDGLAVVGTAEVEEARHISVMEDGRLLIAGFARAANLSSRFAAVRLLASGMPDPDFGTNGIALYALSQPGSFAMGAALQPDGRFVIAGWTGTSELSAYQPAVIRLAADGTVDREFEPADASPLALTAFPNPLAAQGSVDLSLAQAGHARLAVYDLLGREVAVLHDGPAPAGASRVSFDAALLAPGTYVLRLVANGAVSARSVTVVR